MTAAAKQLTLEDKRQPFSPGVWSHLCLTSIPLAHSTLVMRLTGEQCNQMETGLNVDKVELDYEEASSYLRTSQTGLATSENSDRPPHPRLRETALAQLSLAIPYTAQQIDDHVQDLISGPLYLAAKSIFEAHSTVEAGQPSIRKGSLEMSGTIEDVKNMDLDLSAISATIQCTDPGIRAQRIRTIVTLRYALQLANGWSMRRKESDPRVYDASSGREDVKWAAYYAMWDIHDAQGPEDDLRRAEQKPLKNSYLALETLAALQQTCYEMQILLDQCEGSQPLGTEHVSSSAQSTEGEAGNTPT